jgi:RNA polymerase sigma factor (sigma-70 family)
VRGLIGQVSATARPISAGLLKPLARESDLRLVELSRAGDEQAFEVLVRRHRHELHVYAARLMGAESRAEDALQHALMSAWVALSDRGAEVANPRAWLYGIVHNSAVSVLRRPRHDTVELDEALEAPHPHAGTDTHLMVGEIFAGLAEMSAPQRHALLMTAVAGSSHGEAASALGVSAGAVRGMVYRARAALRRAAAAVLPPGLVNWVTGVGHRRLRLPVDPTDAAVATSASAGVAATVVKGGAVIAAVGALAGAGPALLPAVSGRAHHHPARTPRTASPRHGSGRLPRTPVLSHRVSAHQASLGFHPARAAVARGDSEHSNGHGSGDEHGPGSPRQGHGGGGRSGSSGSSGRGPSETGSSNGDSSGSGSSGGGSSNGGSPGSSSSDGSSSGRGSSGSSSSGRGGSSGSSSSGRGGSSGSSSSESGGSLGNDASSGRSGSSDDGHGDAGSSTADSGSSATPSSSGAGSGDGGGTDDERSGSGR